MGLDIWTTIGDENGTYQIRNGYNQRNLLEEVCGNSFDEYGSIILYEDQCLEILNSCNYKIAYLKHLDSDRQDRDGYPTWHNLAKWRLLQEMTHEALEAIRDGKKVELHESY